MLSSLKILERTATERKNTIKKLWKLNPTHVNHLGNYALFLKNIRKDYDRAEEYDKKAVESNPSNAINLGNYAVFLEKIRKDYDKAEEYYKKAIESNPSNAI